MINGIGHIGLAVKNIDEFLKGFCSTFLLPVPEVRDIPERQLKVALIDLGNAQLEVLEDYSSDGVIARFVRERGNGIHHFCLTSDDVAAEAESLDAKGVPLTENRPKCGVRGKCVTFVSSEVFGGISVELSEP